jgi:hypothetical protein
MNGNGKEFRVVVTWNEGTDYMKFEFPDLDTSDADSYAKACFKLATFAEVRDKGWLADGTHVGYFRDIFLGVTFYRLYEIRTYAHRAPCFVFRERADSREKLLVTLKEVKGEKVEIIIKE